MKPPKPCIEPRCPRYALPGKSRCATHQREHEAARLSDPSVTGRGARSKVPAGVRKYVLAKFRYRCAQCRQHQQRLLALRRRLHLHHLDGDAENHDPANLEPLCSPGCHEKAHAR